MSNLELLLEELLEGRFEDAQKKYPEAEEVLAQLKAAGVDSKYAQWFGKAWTKESPYVRREFSIEDLVRLFQTYDNMLKKKLIPEPMKRNRDINSFPEFEFWVNFVEGLQQQIEKREEEKARADDKEVLYRDNRYLVIKPNSREASCRFGKGTKWCISADDDNYFNRYSKEGANFYFFIDRQTDDKDALAVYNNGDTVEVFDAADNSRPFSYLINKYPEKIHETIYKIAFGDKYDEFSEHMSNPLGTLEKLGNSEAVWDFLDEDFYRFAEYQQLKFFMDLLRQLNSVDTIPAVAETFVDGVYWRVGLSQEDITFDQFMKIYLLAKPLAEKSSSHIFQELPPSLLNYAAGKLQKNQADPYLLAMLIGEIEQGFDKYPEAEGKLSSALAEFFLGAYAEDTYRLFQQHPDFLKKAVRMALARWENFLEGRSFQRLVAKLLAGESNIPWRVAQAFVDMFPHLWNFYQALPADKAEEEFLRTIPYLLKQNLRPLKEEEAFMEENRQLFLALLQRSQGQLQNLLPFDLNSIQESARKTAMSLIRRDMSRFFPGLIKD